MSDTQAAMREFRFLDEKRKLGSLSPGEEYRWNELREWMGAAYPAEPFIDPQAYEAAPQGYYANDGQWYPYPEGYDANAYAYPQQQPAYDPSGYVDPQAYAGGYDAQGNWVGYGYQGYAQDPYQGYAPVDPAQQTWAPQEPADTAFTADDIDIPAFSEAEMWNAAQAAQAAQSLPGQLQPMPVESQEPPAELPQAFDDSAPVDEVSFETVVPESAELGGTWQDSAATAPELAAPTGAVDTELSFADVASFEEPASPGAELQAVAAQDPSTANSEWSSAASEGDSFSGSYDGAPASNGVSEDGVLALAPADEVAAAPATAPAEEVLSLQSADVDSAAVVPEAHKGWGAADAAPVATENGGETSAAPAVEAIPLASSEADSNWSAPAAEAVDAQAIPLQSAEATSSWGSPAAEAFDAPTADSDSSGSPASAAAVDAPAPQSLSAEDARWGSPAAAPLDAPVAEATPLSSSESVEFGSAHSTVTLDAPVAEAIPLSSTESEGTGNSSFADAPVAPQSLSAEDTRWGSSAAASLDAPVAEAIPLSSTEATGTEDSSSDDATAAPQSLSAEDARWGASSSSAVDRFAAATLPLSSTEEEGIANSLPAASLDEPVAEAIPLASASPAASLDAPVSEAIPLSSTEADGAGDPTADASADQAIPLSASEEDGTWNAPSSAAVEAPMTEALSSTESATHWGSADEAIPLSSAEAVSSGGSPTLDAPVAEALPLSPTDSSWDSPSAAAVDASAAPSHWGAPADEAVDAPTANVDSSWNTAPAAAVESPPPSLSAEDSRWGSAAEAIDAPSADSDSSWSSASAAVEAPAPQSLSAEDARWGAPSEEAAHSSWGSPSEAAYEPAAASSSEWGAPAAESDTSWGASPAAVLDAPAAEAIPFAHADAASSWAPPSAATAYEPAAEAPPLEQAPVNTGWGATEPAATDAQPVYELEPEAAIPLTVEDTEASAGTAAWKDLDATPTAEATDFTEEEALPFQAPVEDPRARLAQELVSSFSRTTSRSLEVDSAPAPFSPPVAPSRSADESLPAPGTVDISGFGPAIVRADEYAEVVAPPEYVDVNPEDLTGSPQDAVPLMASNEFVTYQPEVTSDGALAVSLEGLDDSLPVSEIPLEPLPEEREVMELASPADFLQAPELTRTGAAWSPLPSQAPQPIEEADLSLDVEVTPDPDPSLEVLLEAADVVEEPVAPVPVEAELAEIELVDDEPAPLPPKAAAAPAPFAIDEQPLFELPPLPLTPSKAVPTAAPANSASFVEGEHRVIIHTVEGQVKRGTLRDLDLLGESLSLEQQSGLTAERIPTQRVKAIFFMATAGSRQPPTTGPKVRVTFSDGRQVAGFSTDFKNGGRGFFVTPADNRTNTARIFIFRSSVQSLAEG